MVGIRKREERLSLKGWRGREPGGDCGCDPGTGFGPDQLNVFWPAGLPPFELTITPCMPGKAANNFQYF